MDVHWNDSNAPCKAYKEPGLEHTACILNRSEEQTFSTFADAFNQEITEHLREESPLLLWKETDFFE